VFLATAVVTALCAGGFAWKSGRGEIISAALAGGVSLQAGLATVIFFQQFGTGVSALLAGPLVRMGLTLGTGCLIAVGFDCWNQSYFVTLGTTYVANLFVETWLLFRQVDGQKRLKQVRSD